MLGFKEPRNKAEILQSHPKGVVPGLSSVPSVLQYRCTQVCVRWL